jgi:hypothetical protein
MHIRRTCSSRCMIISVCRQGAGAVSNGQVRILNTLRVLDGSVCQEGGDSTTHHLLVTT